MNRGDELCKAEIKGDGRRCHNLATHGNYCHVHKDAGTRAPANEVRRAQSKAEFLRIFGIDAVDSLCGNQMQHALDRCSSIWYTTDLGRLTGVLFITGAPPYVAILGVCSDTGENKTLLQKCIATSLKKSMIGIKSTFLSTIEAQSMGFRELFPGILLRYPPMATSRRPEIELRVVEMLNQP